MTAILFFAFCFVYLVLAGVVSKLPALATKDDATKTLTGLVWPVTLPFLLGSGITTRVIEAKANAKRDFALPPARARETTGLQRMQRYIDDRGMDETE